MSSFRYRVFPLRSLVVVSLVGAALAARADIAVLREKGPHSGSAFSNPGLVADAPAGLKVAMKTADVKIHLRPGDGDTLRADCTADFEIEDSSPAELAGQLYLVGFPVTGLSSKIVTIDSFKVTVDGKEPPTVLRRGIAISRREAKLVDSLVSGKLDARFAPKISHYAWCVDFTGGSAYRASYVWQHPSQPGSTVRVQVAYSVTIHPQSLHYSKSYDSEESDDEVIPFRSLNVENWKDRYYLFDYILCSGATWDGPIGKEVVELSSATGLGLKVYDVFVTARRPPEFYLSDESPTNEEPSFDGVRGQERREIDDRNHVIRWILKNGDPSEDLLIAIPVSALKR